MKSPRVQFTLRRMMLTVAIVALGLASLPVLVDLLSGDGPFHATSRVTRSWNRESPPSITVDDFEGSIDVLPSSDGQVSAEIMCVSVTSRSQWSADRALNTIDVTTSQRGNDIQIVAAGASVADFLWRGYITNTAHVELRVPDGVRLSLRVGHGRIAVGEGFLAGKRVRRPVAASSIRARNESKTRGLFGEGDIIIDTAKSSVRLAAIRGRSPYNFTRQGKSRSARRTL